MPLYHNDFVTRACDIGPHQAYDDDDIYLNQFLTDVFLHP